MSIKIDFETDVLIVGGGPSGATLARLLSKKNKNNILLEKNFNFDKPCGGGIKSQVFREFDIPKDLEKKEIKVFNLKSIKNDISVNLNNSSISIVLRQEFDKKLRDLAQESGSKVLEGRFLECFFENDYVISKIKMNNEIIHIRSNYLVGADGVQSTVRKKVFGNNTNALLTNYALIDNKDIDYCDFYFGDDYSPNEYAWIFPHGNKVSVGAVLKDDDAKTVFGKFKDKYYENEKVKGYFIPCWNDDKAFYKNRTFLVGDAAGHVLPFTYEGIYFAMKSAEILSKAIINDEPKMYEELWNETYLKKFRFFKFMQKIFLSNDFFVNIMLKFFGKEKLQRKALSYWDGSSQPISNKKILLKIFTLFFRK